MPALPTNWTYASVHQLADVQDRSITDGPFGSNLKTSHYTGSGPRVIRLQNIGEGKFIDDKAHISEDHYEALKDYAVFAGDIVIRALGEPAPRACRVPDDLGPAIVKADCIRLKVARHVSSEYVMWALNSPPVQAAAAKMIHGVGRPRLNLGEIKSIPIPLPPYEEQVKIAGEIKTRLIAANDLKRALEFALVRAGEARRALRVEAFAGRLVPQNERDEPAAIPVVTPKAPITEQRRRKEKSMKARVSVPGSTHRPIIEVLRAHGQSMTPEELFRAAKFQVSEVDAFYRELAAHRDEIQQEKPSGREALRWPGQARISLQLKAEKNK
jgi:type I restriction enzyme, S subunit